MINFKWDMTEKEFKNLMTAELDDLDGTSDYDGAVFFGDLKVEFCFNHSAGAFINVFQYGLHGMDMLADGTPYGELGDLEDEIVIPHRRTFESFAKSVEQQILRLVRVSEELMKVASGETNPDKWYPDGQGYKIDDIARDINVYEKGETNMNKITITYAFECEDDTIVTYWVDKDGSHMEAKYINEDYIEQDPNYVTETLEYNSSEAEPLAVMAKEWLGEVTEYLDCTDNGNVRPGLADEELEMVFGDYNNSTLFAVERALQTIVNPSATVDDRPHGWYMRIKEAAQMVACKLSYHPELKFAFCESDSIEALEDPANHVDNGGWHGIKRIEGFFDNEPDEFIVAVGHFGGGNVGFGYADSECEPEDKVNAVCKAICEGTGWADDQYIYIEEDE